MTAAIHPVHGIFIACLVGMAFVFSTPFSRAIRETILAATVAVAVFWLLLSLSPYPFSETLRTVARHGALANAIHYPMSDLSAFYLKLAPWSGLYLLGLLLVLVWCAHPFLGKRGRSNHPFVGLGALVLTVFAFCFFSIRRPTASYYLIMLSPAFIAGALYLVDARRSSRGRRSVALPLGITGGVFRHL